MPTPRLQLADNPFWILEVGLSMSALEIERQGKKLLGMLALRLPGADSVNTPIGKRVRSQESVRAALADLRDPSLRLRWEIWTARSHGDSSSASVSVPPEPPSDSTFRPLDLRWSAALADCGWESR